MAKSPHLLQPAPPSVLLVAPEGSQRSALQAILREAGCRTFICSRCCDALDLIQFASVVIVEQTLPNGCWQDLVQAAGELSRVPAVIVATRQADANLRREVLQSGGFDLLAPPFQTEQVLAVVRNAYRRRSAGREGGARPLPAARQGRALVAGAS